MRVSWIGWTAATAIHGHFAEDAIALGMWVRGGVGREAWACGGMGDVDYALLRARALAAVTCAPNVAGGAYRATRLLIKTAMANNKINPSIEAPAAHCTLRRKRA